MTAPALVWITGASRGIGAGLAATVPFEATVINVSRSPGAPPDRYVEADLATESGWDAVAEDLAKRLAGYDGPRVVFVSNAGTIEPVGFAGEVDAAAYRGAVLLNAAAPQILGDAFVRAVRESGFRGPALLIHLTSGAAQTPYSGWSSYGPAKAAVNHWVRTVAAEQAERGSNVRVVAVGPGVVATGMQKRVRESDASDFPNVARFRRLHEAGELADPMDVGQRLWRLVDTLDNGAVVDLRNV